MGEGWACRLHRRVGGMGRWDIYPVLIPLWCFFNSGVAVVLLQYFRGRFLVGDAVGYRHGTRNLAMQKGRFVGLTVFSCRTRTKL